MKHSIKRFKNEVVEEKGNGDAFEVEFSDSLRDSCASRNGRTYESVGLRPNQFMVLHFEPLSAIAV